jgi:hypothetical protein
MVDIQFIEAIPSIILSSKAVTKEIALATFLEYGKRSVDALKASEDCEEYDVFLRTDPRKQKILRSLKNVEKLTQPFMMEDDKDVCRSVSIARGLNDSPTGASHAGSNLILWNRPKFKAKLSIRFSKFGDAEASFSYIASQFIKSAISLQADAGLFGLEKTLGGEPDSNRIVTDDVYGIILNKERIAELGGVPYLEGLRLSITEYETALGSRFAVQANPDASQVDSELSKYLPSTAPTPPPPERLGRHQLRKQ